jgi:hypothetical protein
MLRTNERLAKFLTRVLISNAANLGTLDADMLVSGERLGRLSAIAIQNRDT